MKNQFTILYFFVAISIVVNAQHKGNYGQNSELISRQNIAKSAYGNAQVFNPYVQQQKKPLQTNNIIRVDVKALKNVKATNYTAVFNLSQIGATAEEANKLINDRINNVRATLLGKGIKEEDIVVDVISFVPVYEVEVQKKIFSTKYNEVPKGFKLQQNIHIRFKDAKIFEAILTACAFNEIYNLVKVDYFIDNIKAIYKGLQKELLTLINEEKEYYKALGFDLANYNKKMADNKYCFFPKDFYQSYQAYNSISFDALKKNKVITKVEKETSYYYQPITYQDYDIVLNPSILEPVVQIGMNIVLEYTPKPKEQKEEPITKTEIKPVYYVLSPNGSIDIKKLETNK